MSKKVSKAKQIEHIAAAMTIGKAKQEKIKKQHITT